MDLTSNLGGRMENGRKKAKEEHIHFCVDISKGADPWIFNVKGL